MTFIQWHAGCQNQPGCFGPQNAYVTLFNTPLNLLIVHGIVALLIGFGIFTLLFRLKKHQKIQWHIALISVVSILVTIVLFFILALIFPIRIVY